MTAAITYFVLRWGLGAICLWAGVEKARGLSTFARGVAGYRLLPLELVRPVAYAIVGAEIAVGAFLVIGLLPLAATAGAVALFLLFAGALGISLARGDRGPCHCFGASDAELISPLALIRAVSLAGLAVLAFAIALGDPGRPDNDAVLPALMMAAALAFTVRVSSLFPLTWSFFKTKPALMPVPTRKVSFKHQPLDVPLIPRQD